MKMTRRDFSHLAAAAAALVPTALLPAATGPATLAARAAAAPQAASGSPQFSNFDDLKWEKIVPELGAEGPDFCMLRVDPKTGASSLLIRVAPGFHVPRHWHSANETNTVIQGTSIFACDDGGKATQGPGSFNYIPARMIHQVWIGEEASLVFVTVDGPWDINWVDGPPGAKKS
ncbi:MAG: cupin domain-containing protein [Terriglobales bacterium]